MENTRFVVYSVCLSGRSYLAKSDRPTNVVLLTPLSKRAGLSGLRARDLGFAVHSARLGGRSSVWESEKSTTSSCV